MTMYISSATVAGQTDPTDMSALAPAVALFHSLSDATRLAILRCLLRGEQRVVDLTTQLGLAQSTVSAHLACLRECGLIIARPQGRASLYTVSPATKSELSSLLMTAEQLLAATGDAVALCPTYGSAGRPGEPTR